MDAVVYRALEVAQKLIDEKMNSEHSINTK